MVFMGKHKEVSAETSEAMEQRFRPIAPKPMPPPPSPMPIGTMVSNIQWRAQKRSRQDYLMPSPVLKTERDVMSYPPPPAWWATGNVEGLLPMAEVRGWCMPAEIFLPSCEEDFRRLSFKGSSFASPWLPSPAVKQMFPIERDLISKLQVTKVIKPRPTRSKCTTIYIDCSNTVDSTNLPRRRQGKWRLSWSYPMRYQPSYQAATITVST
ncbi:unnamed protein product [Urochloa humidicola]